MVKVDDLTAAIMSEMQKYTDKVSREVRLLCFEKAEKLRTLISQDAPVRKAKKGGKYKKSWKTTTLYDNATATKIVAHSTKPRLTHLLELGHAKRGGGRVEGRPHIRKNEQEIIKELLSDIEKAVKA